MKNQTYLTIFTILLSLQISFIISVEYDKVDNVTVLTEANFDDFIKEKKNVLVKFYAPWCGHCQALAPTFSKAAGILEKENIFLAQVDSTENKLLEKKYNINSYPTIYLFQNDSNTLKPFEELRTLKNIINWSRNNTIGLLKELYTVNDIESFKEFYNISIIFYGTDKQCIETLQKAALSYGDNTNVRFGLYQNKDNTEYSKKVEENTLAYWDKNEQNLNELTYNDNKFSNENVKRFLLYCSLPLVTKNFDKNYGDLIFNKNFNGLFLLIKDDNENKEKYFNLLNDLSRKISKKLQKDDLKIIVTDIKTGIQKRLIDYFNVRSKDLPKIKIADNRKGSLTIYEFEGEINEENILAFINNWEEGKLEPYIKSQEIPLEQNDLVYTLVGKTFKKEVIENNKDVLVKFYAPWCENSKNFAPIYKELANILLKKNNNENLRIAEIDATENDVPNIYLSSFPSLKLYSAGKKENPVDFEGEKNIEQIIDFLKKNCAHPLKINDAKSDL